MRDAGPVEELPDKNGIKGLTEIIGWWNRWNHWVCRVCLMSVVPHSNLDIPYISAEEEEEGYVWQLGDLVDILDKSAREKRAHRDFWCFFWPYEDLFLSTVTTIGGMNWISNVINGSVGVYRCQRDGITPNSLLFQPLNPSKSYIRVPYWWKDIEVSMSLTARSPSVFCNISIVT